MTCWEYDMGVYKREDKEFKARLQRIADLKAKQIAYNESLMSLARLNVPEQSFEQCGHDIGTGLGRAIVGLWPLRFYLAAAALVTAVICLLWH